MDTKSPQHKGFKKITLQKFLRVFRRHGADKTDVSMHPQRDWFMLLIASALVFVISLLYTGNILVEVLYREISGEERVVRTDANILNEDNFEKALDFFKKRKVQFEDLMQNPPNLPDPAPLPDTTSKVVE
jgi:hypothetical protein